MEISEAWDEAHLLQTDKAWDAIHRCLTDGTLSTAHSQNSLSRLILGGKQLYAGDEYIINLIDLDELGALSNALADVDEEWFLARYDVVLKDSDYGAYPISTHDRAYTWEYFSGIPSFVARAAAERRAVIFTVDQ
jgi:hypothetical protein